MRLFDAEEILVPQKTPMYFLATDLDNSELQK